MDRLQVLTWILCAVISVKSSFGSDLKAQYLDVWLEYRSVQDEMLKLKTELDFEFTRLANRTFTALDERENKRLKDGYSSCFQLWMRMLRTDIGSLMIKEYPAPCSGILVRILRAIDERMMKQNAEIGVDIDRINKCINNAQNCTSQRELATLRTQVSHMRDQWSQYKKDEFLRMWRNMIGCYGYLSVKVQSKLFELSENASRCESITYEQYLKEIGLMPISMFRLIGSSTDWTRIVKLPFPPPTIDIKYQEKSEIMNILRSLRNTIMEYVNMHVTSEMNSVISLSLTDMSIPMTFISNQQNVSEEYESCHQEKLKGIFRTVRNYYEAYLNKVCFYGLVDAKNEFLNIVQCDLRKFEDGLSKIRNCWADEEICRKIASRLDKFDTSLRSWRVFSLKSAMQGARYCYIEANQFIYSGIIRSIDLLKNCENLRIPYIYYNLTENVQPYPPYEKSELCFVELEDWMY